MIKVQNAVSESEHKIKGLNVLLKTETGNQNKLGKLWEKAAKDVNYTAQ